MPVLEWTEGLKVGVDFMDNDHEEAVSMINAMAEAHGAERAALFRDFLSHAEAHFAREEEMMQRNDFFAYQPHKMEHDRVLEDLRQVMARIEAGEEDELAGFFKEDLPHWLITHLKSMDSVTAQACSD